MPRVLITGMAGVGKSTLLAELERRGYEVLETDDDGWSIEVRDHDGRVVDTVWDEPRMTRLLSESEDGLLVVSGCVSNQGRFYDRFDEVVLLSVPRDVMLARIESRTTNGFGKRPAERARILTDLAEVEPLLRSSCTRELDGTRPVPELADAVERIAAS